MRLINEKIAWSKEKCGRGIQGNSYRLEKIKIKDSLNAINADISKAKQYKKALNAKSPQPIHA